MIDIIYRPAAERDLSDILPLWRDLQAINAGFDPRLRLTPNAVDWFRNYLDSQLGSESMAVLVAEVEGQIVGYTFGQVLLRPTLISGDCGYVADICVKEGFRGNGIGRQLYNNLRAWFVERGLAAIEVQVVRANPASQAFWRKMGYDDFLRTLRCDL